MASLLPPAEVTFTDANGVPLAGGSVTFYLPGTTTPKDTWQNSGQSILNSNPITLDSAGRAIIYGSGSYRQVVKDAVGNLIWDQITSEPGSGPISFAGTSSGTANAQILSSGTFSSVDGSILSFIAGLSNTAAMTIAVGGSAPIPVTKNGPTGPIALASGDIVAGNVYSVQYNAGTASFQLLQSVSPTVQTGTFLAGYLFGLTLSNDGVDAVNNIDIATGSAGSDTSVFALMTLASPLVKKLNVNWVVGTNQGGLDTGTVANGTYHVWLIQRSDTSVVDVLFSASATAPTMPAGYDRKRRIGSILRAAAAIVLFKQTVNLFKRVPAVDRNSASVTSAIPLALSVPLGIQVQPILSISLTVNSISDAHIDLGDGSNFTSVQPVVHAINSQASGTAANSSMVSGGLVTDTSAQIMFAMLAAAGTVNAGTVITLGWIDTRGIN